MTDLLTPDDHAHFLEHGYIVVKHAVPSDVMAAAVAALEAGEYSGQVGGADYRAVQSEAVNACVTDTVHQAIAELFGPDAPFERKRSATDMPRPQEVGKAWPEPRAHTDDDDPTLMPNSWALGMFLFLTPVRPHGGAFILYPGSYRRYQQILAETPSLLKAVDHDPAISGPGEELLAEPGDLLLFHHLMGHSGSPNVSDPTTRHALLDRWNPDGRIVPGGKPFEAMSTIEKANSLRFQSAHFGTEFSKFGETLPPSGEFDGITAHATLFSEGAAHIFWTTGDRTIRHAVSPAGEDWSERDSLPSLAAPIETLAVFRRGADAVLFVGTEQGTQLFASADLQTWRPLAESDARRGIGHFTTGFGSRAAKGFVLLTTDADRITARSGDTWEAAGGAPILAAHAPGGIESIALMPTLGEGQYALIADVRTEPGLRPHYTTGRDSVVFSGPLQPLPYSSLGPPRDLQVFARARNYWLVTFLAESRLCWGEIDWERPEPTLQEIGTPDAWRHALEIIGVLS